jgi:hypothetical protein
MEIRVVPCFADTGVLIKSDLSKLDEEVLTPCCHESYLLLSRRSSYTGVQSC